MTSLSRRIGNFAAPWMFAIAVSFLVCQAILIVLWVDVPSLRESTLLLTGEVDDDELLAMSVQMSPRLRLVEGLAVGWMMLVWPFVLVESVWHWLTRPKTRVTFWYHAYALLFAVCPSLRMAARSYELGGKLWLPGLGWKRPDHRLRRRLQRHLSLPMIGIALLILPVLVIEFFLKEQVARYAWLRIALHTSTGIIWFAFAAEFILMISIADKKWKYVRTHWIDLLIIALPFISFLRTLQAVRGTRLAKLAKLPAMTKLFRAYRLRGTVVKAFRALVLLDVAERFGQQSTAERIERMRGDLASLQRECRVLRLSIARLERRQREEVISESAAEAAPPIIPPASPMDCEKSPIA